MTTIPAFSVFDSAAAAYMAPFYQPAIGMAQRVFEDMVLDPNHQFGQHPADYTLFHVGAFDDQTGMLEPMPSPIVLANGLQVVAAARESQNDMFFLKEKEQDNA